MYIMTYLFLKMKGIEIKALTIKREVVLGKEENVR